ncbi:nucleotidyl transferase AbiEii/AbiGii toxin family protein [Citrifermentans bremense]|uniref:nucleotidyl transferase AbiEii/AbiGii toxin family protein n=1 Tax=Citrifermentans bremense TaxID=60035 RepID=UPI0003FE3053|nr:nucleotidyl transferase AbiEii/AbiGii toxin family protein [Citrifermentans bremense]
MNQAIAQMLEKYKPQSLDDTTRALREIIQEVALLGLFRAKFFEHAAFYGGTALRILYGLDRFSEDLDFSLLAPSKDFDLAKYSTALEVELQSFGFKITVEKVDKAVGTAMQSAFLKGNTRNELLVIETRMDLVTSIPANQTVKVKLEVDTDPPSGFNTQTKYLLNPTSFSVRTYTLPDLFAGKMHALLCRKWKNRVKGRDWYDFVWYLANHPELHLAHLEQRMRQTAHWTGDDPLSADAFKVILNSAIDRLDVDQARQDVAPFVKDQRALDIWSQDFFRDIAGKIRIA